MTKVSIVSIPASGYRPNLRPQEFERLSGSTGFVGFRITDGDLKKGIGVGYSTLPVHAYIPMMQVGSQILCLEDEPVAYLDQMRAKRVCDKYRKRFKRRNPQTNKRFIILGVTVK